MLSPASTTQAYFVLRFPILRWVSPLFFIGILQGIAAGVGTSNFLPAALIVSLNSSSFWLNEEYSSQLSGIVEFWFLDGPFLFCFLFRCIRHMRPHIWPHIVRARGCLISCRSPPGPSNITSSNIFVVLVTSMYFNKIRNVSSLRRYTLTLSTT